MFGGPTQYVTIAGVGFRSKLTVEGSSLRRTIRDVIGSGIRPSVVSNQRFTKLFSMKHLPPSQRQLYFVEDTLDPSTLWLPVLHHTHFLSSGWGERSLTISEMGIAFGYPRQVHSYLEEWMFRLTPYILLIRLFQESVNIVSSGMSGPPVSGSSSGDSVTSTPQSTMYNLTDELQERTNESTGIRESWLPSLNIWLPHTWASGSHTVVKRDDAAVPCHLWDQRITLLFPHTASLLPFLRQLCLRRYRKNLFQDFRSYMADRYGANWVVLLSQARRVRFSSSHQGGGDSIFSTIHIWSCVQSSFYKIQMSLLKR